MLIYSKAKKKLPALNTLIFFQSKLGWTEQVFLKNYINPYENLGIYKKKFSSPSEEKSKTEFID